MSVKYIDLSGEGLVVANSPDNYLEVVSTAVPEQQFMTGRGSMSPISPVQLISTDGGYIQLFNSSPPARAPASLVVNYVLDQNGSHVPIYSTVPVATTDNYLTLLAAHPELDDDEPKVPSHILDHMYAKKPKEPGSEQSKPRRRGRKKDTVVAIRKVQPAPKVTSPKPAKVNIMRKRSIPTTAAAVAAATSRAIATLQPVFPSRPNILQNAKSSTSSISAVSPGTNSSVQCPLPKQFSKGAPIRLVNVISEESELEGSSGQEGYLHQPEPPMSSFVTDPTNTDSQVCYLLAPNSSTKTDNDETVIFQHDSDPLGSDFSGCSISPAQPSASGTLILDDKEFYFTYD